MAFRIGKDVKNEHVSTSETMSYKDAHQEFGFHLETLLWQWNTVYCPK